MKKEISELQHMFYSLIQNTIAQLDSGEQPVPVNVIHDTLLWELPQDLKKIYEKLQTDEFDRLQQCTTLKELFGVLDGCWNFIDPYLLEFIIKEHGNKKLKYDIEQYLDKLKQFCELTTVHQLIKFWKPDHKYSDIPREYIEELNQCRYPITLSLQSLQIKTSSFNAPLSKKAAALYDITETTMTMVTSII